MIWSKIIFTIIYLFADSLEAHLFLWKVQTNMTNIRICRIPFLTGWRCAWLPQPPPVWPTDSDRGFPSKLSEPDEVLTVVQNGKLVTWPEHVLTNKQWQRLVGTRDDYNCGPKSKVGGMTRICSLIIWWTESDRGFPSKLLKPDDRWYNFGKIETVALRPNLQTWPEFFDRLNNRQCLKLSQPKNWWCDMSLSRYHPYVSMRDVHQMTNDKTQTANANRNCSIINLGRKLS